MGLASRGYVRSWSGDSKKAIILRNGSATKFGISLFSTARSTASTIQEVFPYSSIADLIYDDAAFSEEIL